MNPQTLNDLAHWATVMSTCFAAGLVIGLLDNPAELPVLVDGLVTEMCQCVYDALPALAGPFASALEAIVAAFALGTDSVKHCKACGDWMVADDSDFCAFCSVEIVANNYHEYEVARVRAQALTVRPARPNRMVRFSQAADPVLEVAPTLRAAYADQSGAYSC
jgi:hypothetical protein